MEERTDPRDYRMRGENPLESGESVLHAPEFMCHAIGKWCDANINNGALCLDLHSNSRSLKSLDLTPLAYRRVVM